MADKEGCTGACPSPPQLQLYQTIIFATPVLFAFMLMLMFCLLYFRRRSRVATIQAHIRAQLFVESLLSTQQSPPEQGLSTSFRKRLPIILFNDEFMSTCQDTQCAVCLSDYQLNEKLQQLPVCSHSFHAPCIDEWLAKNKTCPICRLSFDEVDIRGIADPFQSGEAHSMQRGAEATRMWEERVVSGAQDHTLHVRSTVSDEESLHDAALSEHDIRGVGVDDHTVNIERS